MSGERFLLCRPQGGLNDMLCQIERCCAYAELHRRVVVVDTNFPTARYFNDDLSNYFVSRQRSLILDLKSSPAPLEGLPVTPEWMTGRIGQYRAVFDRGARGFVEEGSNRLSSFDFATDHAAPLLVHHGAGGGDASIFALARMRLHDSVVDVLIERLRRLPPEYSALHIRNTDHRADFSRSLDSAAAQIAGPVFVATDNLDTLRACQAAFGAERIHAFATLPDLGGAPLHRGVTALSPRVRNVDAIVDLLLLALARRLEAFPLVANASGAQYSGFSRLAWALSNFRPLLARLIGRDDPYLARSASPLG